MRAIVVSLMLLVGSAVAFVPPSTTAFKNQRSLFSEKNSHSTAAIAAATPTKNKKKPVFPTPKVTSSTPIPQSSRNFKQLLEARRCLLELELVAEKARDYLEFLDNVQDVVRQYLQQESGIAQVSKSNVNNNDLVGNDVVPEFQHVQEATDYLANIQKASKSAMTYLENLLSVQRRLRAYINKLQAENSKSITTTTNHQNDDEQLQQAQFHLNDLEETAEGARDYLRYLQTITGVVQQYLKDPNLQGIVLQDFMLAVQPQGMKQLQDFSPKKQQQRLEGSKDKKALPESNKPTHQNKLPPSYLEQSTTAPHETIDWSHYKAPSNNDGGETFATVVAEAETVAPTTTAKSTASYLAKMPVTSALRKKKVAAYKSYLESLLSDSSIEKKGMPKSYLDQVTNASPKEPVDWSQYKAKASVIKHEPTAATLDTTTTATSYLESMSKSFATSSRGKKAAKTSYLDTMSSTQSAIPESITKGMPPSYLEETTLPHETVDWSRFKATPLSESDSNSVDTSSTTTAQPLQSRSESCRSSSYHAGYLQTLTSSSTTGALGKKTVLASYLDNVASSVNASPEITIPRTANYRIAQYPEKNQMASAAAAYLDSMSSSSSSSSSAWSSPSQQDTETPKASASTRSYLDKVADSKEEPIDWSQFKASSTSPVAEKSAETKSKPAPAAPATSGGSYLDEMTSPTAAAASAPPSTKAAPSTSYLDTMATPVSDVKVAERNVPDLKSFDESETVALTRPPPTTGNIQPPALSSTTAANPVQRSELKSGTRMLDQLSLSSTPSDKVPGTLKFFASRVAPHLSEPTSLPKPRDPTWELNDVVRYVPVQGKASLYWAVTFWPQRKERRRDY